MKKVFSTAAALLAAAALFAGCKDNEKLVDDKGNGEGTSATESMNDTMSTGSESYSDAESSETGDVDGDGFLEEFGTDVNDIVDDVVTGAEDIVSDVLDVGDGR
ncbi:MAG: hypothetical protein J1E40_08550 [Oscillospiraceae bacterium]|nr:hypothetical protein [Oscillospiraceae bacterium]